MAGTSPAMTACAHDRGTQAVRIKQPIHGLAMAGLHNSALQLQHDPEKWPPVSRLREAVPAAGIFGLRFGGRSQVG
jgi:hypothetical protein